MIKVEWIRKISSAEISTCLFEYRFLIRRFPQWFALLIGRIENQEIRQLLLPNLVDESGKYHEEPSHLDHLDSLINSLNIKFPKIEVSAKTQSIEHWFFNLFYSGDIYKCLCVLGPATESVSYQFLNPLEESIRLNFPIENVDFTYFDLHRQEVEIKHAGDLAKAIELIETNKKDIAINPVQKEYHINEGLKMHQEFWDNVKSLL